MYSCRQITALNNTALVHGAHATNTWRVRKHFGSRYPKTRHLSPRYLAAWEIARLRGNKDVLSSTIRLHLIRVQRIQTIRWSAPPYPFRSENVLAAYTIPRDRASHQWLSITIRHSSFSSLISYMLVAHAILTSFCNCYSVIRASRTRCTSHSQQQRTENAPVVTPQNRAKSSLPLALSKLDRSNTPPANADISPSLKTNIRVTSLIRGRHSHHNRDLTFSFETRYLFIYSQTRVLFLFWSR